MLLLLSLLKLLWQIIPLRYRCVGGGAGGRLGNLFTFVTLQPHRKDTTEHIKTNNDNVEDTAAVQDNLRHRVTILNTLALSFEVPTIGI